MCSSQFTYNIILNFGFQFLLLFNFLWKFDSEDLAGMGKKLIICLKTCSFETCSLCLLESSMDLHATGLFYLSFGFLSLAYGLHERTALIQHDLLVYLFSMHIKYVFLLFWSCQMSIVHLVIFSNLIWCHMWCRVLDLVTCISHVTLEMWIVHYLCKILIA